MNRLARILLVITLLLLSYEVITSQAQSPQPSPQMVAANELFKAQRWQEAATAYENILKSETNNADAWYRLATARYSLKQYQAAAAAFQKNAEITNSGAAMFNLACLYSLMGDKDKSIEWLAKAVDNPKTFLQSINFNDSDLANVKDDPRFKSLAEKVDRSIHPCMYRPEAREFDFWVGEWDVYNPQGQQTGTSVILRFAGGCGILENWTDRFGGTGKSLNFYDEEAGKWFQYWIGAKGGPLRYSGIYKDKAIRYEGESVSKDGKRTLMRLTFFNVDANTVRQFAETSNDEGKTWTTSYDFKYVRRRAQ